MIYYLRKVGRTGQLTTIIATRVQRRGNMAHKCIIAFIPATLKFYLPVGLLCAAFWGITVVVLLVMAQEWRGVGVVGILTTTRLINAVLIRRQSGNKVWNGAVEPNVMGDIFVLLSQGRWIRITGLVA
jgi:hypothetical protein